MKNLLGLNEDYQLDLKSSKKLSEERVLEIDTKSEEDLELTEGDNTDSNEEDEDDVSEKEDLVNSDSENNDSKKGEETPPDDTEEKKGSAGPSDSVNFNMKLDGGFDKRVLNAKTAVDIANILRDFLTKMSTEAKAAQ